jgi:hypothetical protein
MSDKKLTALQWLLEQWPILESQLPSSIIDEALQMEREQIEEVAMYHRDSAVQIDCIRSYMKKNYGGKDESNH